ncbi:hypothetical protein LTR95_007702 [Oleoguttula sp. CCFEE 5521]
MHSIKRANRRQAWYAQADGVFPGLRDETYNPFGRSNPPRGRTTTQPRTNQPHTKQPVRRATEPIGEKSNIFNGDAGLLFHSHAEFDAQAEDCATFKPASTVLEPYEDTENKPLSKPISLRSQICALFGSYMTLLLLTVPVGMAINYAHVGSLPVFTVNFLAVVACNATLMTATQQLGKYLGEQAESLLSMTFGNAGQLITSIILLKSRQIAILQASLLGGMLQNLLVMTGLAFFIGGIGRQEQYFNTTAAQTISMFLLLAVLSLLVPTMSRLLGHATAEGVLAQSRGTAVIILVSYGLFLVFSLWTNRAALIEPSQRVPKRKREKDYGDALRSIVAMGAISAATIGGQVNQAQPVQDHEEDEDEDKKPKMTRAFALLSMIVFTALLALNTEYATNSLQGLMAERKLSNTFMGTVIIPILSNDFMALQAASADRMDHALRLTLERAVQIALMLVPLVVLIAWIMGVNDLSLEFNDFTVGCLFASIIIVCYVVQQGKSNW